MKYLYYIFRLFFTPSCNHKFTIYSTGSIHNREGEQFGNFYNLQCTKCGDIVRRNLEV